MVFPFIGRQFNFGEFLKVFVTFGFVYDIIIFTVSYGSIVDGVSSLDTVSYFRIKFFYQLLFLATNFFCNFACMWLQQMEWLYAFSVLALYPRIITMLT